VVVAEDREWTAENRDLATWLNEHYRIGDHPGTAMQYIPSYERETVVRLCKATGAKVLKIKEEPDPPGVVY
jgi:hypothetical protein